ncbi:MAG: efflux transporter outer membrane subunit [Alphaproteobacteria bacterium]|nr:efflux transporter outer membrane subunit [Alphaproteobacteria bacterium]
MLYLKFLFSIILSCFVLVGCAVGPDFKSPQAPQTDSYTESELPPDTVEAKTLGGDAQHFIKEKDIPGCWWTLFHSEPLNELIEKALKNNATLQAANAAFRQAEANLQISLSALYPFINVQIQPERQRFNPAIFDVQSAPVTFNLYNATANVSYTLDFFGAIRRQIEMSEAQLESQGFQTEATYLTLTTNIVTSAITEASLRGQIQATEELIKAQEKILAITKKKFDLGGVSRLDVLAQETQLAQTRSSLPPLQNNLARIRNALAVLIGVLPSESEIPAFNLEDFHLPTELPVSLPSRLVQQRPDIRAAEALLHAATAQVGVATANLLPQITLTGVYGWTSDQLQTLFMHRSNIWDILANILQPVFQGGALLAKRRGTLAALEQAAAQYQQTVLLAFQNVADTLKALELDAQQLKSQTEASNAAFNTLKLSESQYKLGAVSYLYLLDAERQYQQTRIGRIQAQAARYADTAALFQALGGGWWNRQTSPLGRSKGEK